MVKDNAQRLFMLSLHIIMLYNIYVFIYNLIKSVAFVCLLYFIYKKNEISVKKLLNYVYNNESIKSLKCYHDQICDTEYCKIMLFCYDKLNESIIIKMHQMIDYLKQKKDGY